jgi:hypothetical protein
MSDWQDDRLRDEELGAALRLLDVPRHRRGFEAELRALLLDGPAAAPAADVPHRPIPHRSRLRRRHGGVAVAVLAAAAVAVTTLLVLTGRTVEGGIAPTRAADVQRALAQGWASAHDLTGTLVVRRRLNETEGITTTTSSFALAADGSLAIRNDESLQVYDAGRGVEVARGPETGGTWFVRRGLAAAAPDGHPQDDLLLDRSLAAVVRAARADDASAVRELRFAGRAAWELTFVVEPNRLGFSGDRIAVTVDRGTRLPVRVLETFRGALVQEVRIDDLRTPAAIPRAAFRVGVPAGAEVGESDDGFAPVPLRAARARVRYPPLAPGWLPEGFALASTLVSAEAGPTGNEGMNPPSRRVVSTTYRRGLERVVITTRVRGTGQWTDPLAAGEGFAEQPEALELQTGALRDARAELVVAPRSIPHVWALTDDLVVTVSGDLLPDELVEVASSLEPVRG